MRPMRWWRRRAPALLFARVIQKHSPLTLRFRLEPNLRDREPGVLDGTRFFGVVIEREGVSSDDFGDPGDDPAVFPRLDKNHYSYKKK